jgi:hypothetical protein
MIDPIEKKRGQLRRVSYAPFSEAESVSHDR